MSIARLKKQIEKDVADAMAKVFAKYDIEVDRVIESPNEFSNLGFIGQDIVDTGRLLKSKVITIGTFNGMWEWAPISPENGFPYGPAVHEGFLAWGKKFIPGRPWDVRAAQNIDPVQIVVNVLNSKGYRVKIKQNNISLL